MVPLSSVTSKTPIQSLEPRLQLSSALLLPVSVASLLRHIEIDVPFVGADKCQYDWLQQPEKKEFTPFSIRLPCAADDRQVHTSSLASHVIYFRYTVQLDPENIGISGGILFLGGAELEKCSEIVNNLQHGRVAFRISAAILKFWVDLYFRSHRRVLVMLLTGKVTKSTPTGFE